MNRTNSANNGTSWEAQIQRTCDDYERRGLARIRKVSPPTRTIGKGQVIYLENPFVDFIGCLKGGRMVALEAKSTAGPRLAIGGESGLTQKQIEAMLRWESMGAKVGLLWQCTSVCNAWVDLAVIRHALTLGDKSIMLKDAHGITQGTGYATADFLPYLV